MPARESFTINGSQIAPGDRQTIDLPVSVLSNHTPMTMPVHVIHGKKPGPVIFISAAVHGDEIIGVEIIRRLLGTLDVAKVRGTVLAVPVVNAFGFINHSRYLPDRRDLNRSFPGSERGSLAARLADLFLTEVVKRCDYGIDLHSAGQHRTNLPQIRISPTRPDTLRLATAFGAPVILPTRLRDGTLRAAARDVGIDVLLYEAGEALRYDELAIRAGVSGVLRVMHALDMIPRRGVQKAQVPSVIGERNFWQRAPEGGILRAFKTIGDSVAKDEVIGIVSDPFGEVDNEILAYDAGLIIGRTNLPVVNQGDALFHIARVTSTADAEARIDTLTEQLNADPLFDEDEII